MPEEDDLEVQLKNALKETAHALRTVGSARREHESAFFLGDLENIEFRILRIDDLLRSMMRLA